MTECAEAFPGFELKPRGPPQLRELLVDVQRKLEQTPHGVLTVASSGDDCAVRLDGVELGKSPLKIRAARLGTARVQLECVRDVPGRIHPVELTAGESRVVLDPAFDAVVHSQGALSLAYRDDRERAARALNDAGAIGKVLGIQRVVVLHVDGSHVPVHVRLETAFGARKDAATLSYPGPLGYDVAAVDSAMRALGAMVPPSRVSGRVASVPSGALIAAGPPPEPDESGVAQELRDASMPRQQHALPGALLAGVAVAGLVVSWVLYADRQAFRKELRPERGVGIDFSILESFRMRGNWLLATASLGATLLAVSDYLWLPEERSVPGWAWIAGAGGVAIAAVGSCPTAATCKSTNACLVPTVSGDPNACSSKCDLVPVIACKSGDGCCPTGCNYGSDTDCSQSCGDGVVSTNETCEPSSTTKPCQASCDDKKACTTDVLTGSPQQCNVVCTNTPITAPMNGDHCCPDGANVSNDNDCDARCGDEIVESGETCDPTTTCPTSCEDDNACTKDTKTGSMDLCNVQCSHTPVVSASSGDGCCPPGGTPALDSDCGVPAGWRAGTLQGTGSSATVG